MSYSFRGLAPLVFVALSACGGGGGGGGGSSPAAVNRAPTANFAFSCADLACTFTSNSTDQDVGDAIVSQSWTFGDGTAAATTPAPPHTFAAAGGYDVSLVVADRSGVSSNVVRRVTVTAPATPAAPHANFTVSCASLDCTFTDTTTYDAGSALQSRLWDFGDSVTLAATNPATHSYAATTLTTFTAKLTITDIAGKTSTSVQSVVVAPPATSLNCVGGNCVLNLTQASQGPGGARQPFLLGTGQPGRHHGADHGNHLPRRLRRSHRHGVHDQWRRGVRREHATADRCRVRHGAGDEPGVRAGDPSSPATLPTAGR